MNESILNYYDEQIIFIIMGLMDLLMKRNSIFLATVIGGAIVTEIIIDDGINKLWRWNNRGVSGLFNALIRNYGKTYQ